MEHSHLQPMKHFHLRSMTTPFTSRECLYLLNKGYSSLERSDKTPPIDEFYGFLNNTLEYQNRAVLNAYQKGELTDNDIEQLKSQCQFSMVRDGAFDWLEKFDKGVLLFINKVIDNEISKSDQLLFAQDNIIRLKKSFLHYENEQLIQRIYINYDLVMIGNVDNKNITIDKLKNVLDSRLNSTSSYMKWIDKKDNGFLEWLNNYQSEALKENSYEQHFYSSLSDIDNLKAEALYCSFKRPDLFSLFLLKARKAWNQKAHRDKNAQKISRTYQMSSESVDQLSELSQQSGRTKTQTIEDLIREAHQKLTRMTNS